ncbi:unnamed protein product, partial [Ectocarpus sp. 12 AP-2014]
MLVFQGCSGIQESSSVDQAIIFLQQQNREERGGDFRAQPWLNVERGRAGGRSEKAFRAAGFSRRACREQQSRGGRGQGA